MVLNTMRIQKMGPTISPSQKIRESASDVVFTPCVCRQVNKVSSCPNVPIVPHDVSNWGQCGLIYVTRPWTNRAMQLYYVVKILALHKHWHLQCWNIFKYCVQLYWSQTEKKPCANTSALFSAHLPRLKHPAAPSIAVHLIPPAKAHQQPARHVLSDKRKSVCKYWYKHH